MLQKLTPSRKRFFVSGVKEKSAAGTSGFGVKWQINPHMKVDSTSLELAEAEHRGFLEALEACGAEVCQVPFIAGAYDSVFIKDNAVVIETPKGSRALLTRPATAERRLEPGLRAAPFRTHGVEIDGQVEVDLEGGDVVVCPAKDLALMGYGFRTSINAAPALRRFLNVRVVPLELRDPYFYHLDTALNLVCADGRCVAFAHPGAFSAESWLTLLELPEIDQIVEVSRAEAMSFALNWVEIEDQIIMGSDVPETRAALEALGKRVLVRPLSQFQLAGGSAACLVAPVHFWD